MVVSAFRDQYAEAELFGSSGTRRFASSTHACARVSWGITPLCAFHALYPGIRGRPGLGLHGQKLGYSTFALEKPFILSVLRRTADPLRRHSANTRTCDGVSQVARSRLKELEQEKTEAEARIKSHSEEMPDVHPNLAEIYRAKVAHLSEALSDPNLSQRAAEDIRSLISNVILMPGSKRGEIDAVLNGGAIVDLVAQKDRTPGAGPRVMSSVVAGARNSHTHRLPKPIFTIRSRGAQRLP